ncbi:CU044_2847 family protein [Catenuloplanes indicus]|uniref:Trypsin-co-occurring domain-containing protein n=1 Tax=Catenuloplanes indicus TaxID=137267 RepID=A0AAE3W8G1_9ACTN|nr:CU044_2847 family protein [Catenuloplanes indicus]MDQ0371210.1 hypothetical protein [Catenuloplanes indicus]
MTETRIVPLVLPDGTEILAEVAVAGTGGDARAAGALSLEDIRGQIATIGAFFADTVKRSLPDPPDRFGIDFGLKLAVESKGLVSVLAKASGEATVTVRLEWDRAEVTDGDPHA